LPNLPPRGAIARADLGGLLALLRSHGERVVMTNGCFDILHPGHVAYLEEAKALGHRLIVAVNADESVRRLKGPSRPINTLASRMKMLAALACVDWVVAFSEDTPAQLYQEATPDVLVKGGDYTPEQVAGADAVLARGGEVRILKFLDGHSTSAIVTKILQG
jgi:D-beta-D-heptose 7-phosphate kinase/D-beta-D-heptose 1-phosphate adenosyltransferase